MVQSNGTEQHPKSIQFSVTRLNGKCDSFIVLNPITKFGAREFNNLLACFFLWLIYVIKSFGDE